MFHVRIIVQSTVALKRWKRLSEQQVYTVENLPELVRSSLHSFVRLDSVSPTATVSTYPTRLSKVLITYVFPRIGSFSMTNVVKQKYQCSLITPAINIETAHWNYFSLDTTIGFAWYSLTQMTLTPVIDGAYYRRSLAWYVTQQHDRVKSMCMLTQWKDAPLIYFQFCRADSRD